MAAEENPYVGPRPFEIDDRRRFFGREREARQLFNRMLAHSVVLFYAQSGCGKTSLINARLLPALRDEGFQVLPIARVKQAPPQGLGREEIRYPYTFNTLLSWSDGEEDPRALLARTLVEGFEQRVAAGADGEPAPCAVIVDQFEELFTAYPSRFADRAPFFAELDELLRRHRMARVLLSIREDYLAHVDPYLPRLAGGRWSRLRLEGLRKPAAIQAVTGPVQDTGRAFEAGVAERLVTDLSRVRARSELGQTRMVEGEFVEPVQLQVVCQNLWENLPQGADRIGEAHLKAFGDVDQALAAFYEQAVERAALASSVGEHEIRGWIEEQLITAADTRGMVIQGDETTAGMPGSVLRELEAIHLVRGEWRHGARWFELTHDRFIRPIQESNQHSGLRAEQQAKKEAQHAKLASDASIWPFTGVTLGLPTLWLAFRENDPFAILGLYVLAFLFASQLPGAVIMSFRWRWYAGSFADLAKFGLTLVALGIAVALAFSRHPFTLIWVALYVLMSLGEKKRHEIYGEPPQVDEAP